MEPTKHESSTQPQSCKGGVSGRFLIKRYLIEEFSVEATSREEALTLLDGGPFKITLIKETVKRTDR